MVAGHDGNRCVLVEESSVKDKPEIVHLVALQVHQHTVTAMHEPLSSRSVNFVGGVPAVDSQSLPAVAPTKAKEVLRLLPAGAHHVFLAVRLAIPPIGNIHLLQLLAFPWPAYLCVLEDPNGLAAAERKFSTFLPWPALQWSWDDTPWPRLM